MKEPKIDLDVDKNMNATLVVECGECRKKSRLSMSQIFPRKNHKMQLRS
jgi:hypothetical protein